MTAYNTRTARVTLPGHNGDEIEAYLAEPSDPGAWPGVVVIHYLPGWDEWTREVTRKFADAGFAAIAPHLYSRWLPATQQELRDRAFACWGPPDAQVMDDIAASARYLKGRPTSNGKVGAIGFCSGGRQAYLAASQVKEVSAVVDCWGVAVIPDDRFTVCEERPVAPIETTADIRVPVLGIFGNDDKSPSPAEVTQVEAELRRHRKFYEIYRYHGAGHGFWTTTSTNYRAEQTQDSWERATQFLAENLT